MSKPTKITQKQRLAFFRACHAACVNLGYSSTDEREEYRKRVMREETGKAHLADLGRTEDFDKVMKRFAADAGDYETACRFAVGDEARKAALIRICCAQVMQLKGAPAGSTDATDYLSGIVEQARVPCGRSLIDSSFWLDVNPDSLTVLFQILDTHRRRLLLQLLNGGTARVALGFEPTARYELLPTGGVRVCYDPHAYADLSSTIQINIRRAS